MGHSPVDVQCRRYSRLPPLQPPVGEGLDIPVASYLAMLLEQAMFCSDLLSACVTGASAKILSAVQSGRDAGKKVLVHCWGGEAHGCCTTVARATPVPIMFLPTVVHDLCMCLLGLQSTCANEAAIQYTH
jgi:hypothetical protein